MNLTEFNFVLDHSTQETLAQARSYSEAQLNSAADGCWTPLQVMEHVCLTEALVFGLLQRPSTDVHESEEVHGSPKLRHLIVDKRSMKIVAPERLHPRGELTNLSAFEARFTSQREALKNALADGTIVVDNRMFPHPLLGMITISDWLYFMVHHTERHMAQLQDQALQPM